MIKLFNIRKKNGRLCSLPQFANFNTTSCLAAQVDKGKWDNKPGNCLLQ